MRRIFATLFLLSVCLISRAEGVITQITMINRGTDQKIRFQQEINPAIIFEGFSDLAGTIQLNASQPFRLICGKRKSNRKYLYTTLIINPGEHIFINNLPDSLYAYVKYNPVRNNELAFFSVMEQKLGAFEGSLTYIPHKRNDAPALRKKLTELHEKRFSFLQKYKSLRHISPEFDSLLVSAFRYKKLYDFYYYCGSEGIRIDELRNQPGYSEFAEELQYSKEQDNSIYFQEALLSKLRIELPVNDGNLERYHEWSKKCDGQTREFVLFNFLEYTTKSPYISEHLIAFQTDFSASILGEYSLVKFDEYVVDEVLGVEVFATAKTSCNNCLLSLDYKEPVTWNSLINEAGVVKYIDFWASWCGGCRASFPDVRKLQEEYKNQDFKVIFVSIDALSRAWIKASEKEKLRSEENFLFLNFDESSVKSTYSIPPIARYLLINKEGKIISAKAPKPSSPELKVLINKLLSEK